MQPHHDSTCPGEVFNMQGAGEVLPHLYETQADCARAHGCARDACPLEASWQHHGNPRDRGLAALIKDFLFAALLGPPKA